MIRYLKSLFQIAVDAGVIFPGQGKTNESHEFLRDLEDTFSSCDSSNLRDVCRIAEFEMFLWTKCIQYDNTEQFEKGGYFNDLYMK